MNDLAPGYAAVLDAVRGIPWPARRRTRSAITGSHPSIARGGAAEFVEHRAYRQGDETSRIDWKLVARTDRVFTRLSLDSTHLPTCFVVDASASMDFPQSPASKWQAARHLTIGLAAMARERGDPVGLTVVTARAERRVAPSTRRTVIAEMAAALEVAPDGAAPLLGGVMDLRDRAARLVLVSDFLGDLEAVQAALRGWTIAGGELFALHVVAAGELDPERALELLVDPEAPSIRRPLTPDGRTAYLRAFGRWRESVARSWRELGAAYHEVVTERESIRQTIRRIVTVDRIPAHG